MTSAKSSLFWFSLLVLVILFFWGVTWDAVPYLSPDDMGKELYPFELTLQGQVPCRDYLWAYGPVTPYYYAFWFRVTEVSIVGARIGMGVIYLLCSLLAYQALRIFTSPAIAFLASLSFLLQEFYYPYYNYNHIGAVPFFLFGIFSLWKFFASHRIRWGYWGALAFAGMALVKINVGVTSFAAFLVSMVIHLGFKEGLKQWRQFVFLPLIFLALVVPGYLFIYAGLPISQIDHCLYMRPAYREFPEYTLWTTFKHLIQWFLVWDRKRLWWLALFLTVGAFGLLGLRKKALPPETRRLVPFLVGSLFLFILFNSSDFFLLGHIYRLDFWSTPPLLLLMGLAAEWARPLFGRRVKMVLGVLIFAGLLFLPFRYLRIAFAARVPERFLDFPRGRVYVTREALPTVQTIRKGTHFVLEHTQPGQEILTIPREPLYCFLTGRRHAVWHTDFEQTTQISEEEEEKYIREIEAKQIPWVLWSNRDGSNPASKIGGHGYFGKTHCRKLGKYLWDHYEEVQRIGTWEVENPRIYHSLKMLRRKS